LKDKQSGSASPAFIDLKANIKPRNIPAKVEAAFFPPAERLDARED